MTTMMITEMTIDYGADDYDDDYGDDRYDDDDEEYDDDDYDGRKGAEEVNPHMNKVMKILNDRSGTDHCIYFDFCSRKSSRNF